MPRLCRYPLYACNDPLADNYVSGWMKADEAGAYAPYTGPQLSGNIKGGLSQIVKRANTCVYHGCNDTLAINYESKVRHHPSCPAWRSLSTVVQLSVCSHQAHPCLPPTGCVMIVGDLQRRLVPVREAGLHGRDLRDVQPALHRVVRVGFAASHVTRLGR